MLADHLTLYSQFDRLLTAVTERLEVTERLLEKYSECGNIELLAAHINSIKVLLVVVGMPFWCFNGGKVLRFMFLKF